MERILSEHMSHSMPVAVADRQHPKQRRIQAGAGRGRGRAGSQLEDLLQRKQREVKPARSSRLHPGATSLPHAPQDTSEAAQPSSLALPPVESSLPAAQGAAPRDFMSVFCHSPSALLMPCWPRACEKLSIYSLKRREGHEAASRMRMSLPGTGGAVCVMDFRSWDL